MTTITSTTSPASTALSQQSATARAAAGDYLTKGAGHTVKDADGDYKPTVGGASAVSPAKVSASTAAALASLSKGG